MEAENAIKEAHLKLKELEQKNDKIMRNISLLITFSLLLLGQVVNSQENISLSIEKGHSNGEDFVTVWLSNNNEKNIVILASAHWSGNEVYTIGPVSYAKLIGNPGKGNEVVTGKLVLTEKGHPQKSNAIDNYVIVKPRPKDHLKGHWLMSYTIFGEEKLLFRSFNNNLKPIIKSLRVDPVLTYHYEGKVYTKELQSNTIYI